MLVIFFLIAIVAMFLIASYFEFVRNEYPIWEAAQWSPTLNFLNEKFVGNNKLYPSLDELKYWLEKMHKWKFIRIIGSDRQGGYVIVRGEKKYRWHLEIFKATASLVSAFGWR